MHPAKYFCTEYEKSKAVSNQIALEAAKEGVPIVAVYPGVIYGPGKVTSGNLVARIVISEKLACLYQKVGFSKLVAHRIESAMKTMIKSSSAVFFLRELIVINENYEAVKIVERFNGRLPGYVGDGNDKFSFSHVDDVVDGHISALGKGQIGERYILT
ncbi:NAD-dependent epimerase/dehydratase [Tanacetum coccineum]